MGSEVSAYPHAACLVLPRMYIQNANAISSPLTWGFPAITAFVGLMTALERRLGAGAGIQLWGVGVLCHDFKAQVETLTRPYQFCLTRNPLLKDGSSAGIVEEGRVHLDVSLIFDVRLRDDMRGEVERIDLAQRIAREVAHMRVAGGSVMPTMPSALAPLQPPTLELLADESQSDERRQQFRRLARKWLPGFALVSRDDLLMKHLEEMRTKEPETTILDAWMDLSRWNIRAEPKSTQNAEDQPNSVKWVTDSRPGWTVPIPVGFASLRPLEPAGSVRGARDSSIPFRFVETVWSIGQWISPHRLRDLKDLTWAPDYAEEHGLYRCVNAYPTSLEDSQQS